MCKCQWTGTHIYPRYTRTGQMLTLTNANRALSILMCTISLFELYGYFSKSQDIVQHWMAMFYLTTSNWYIWSYRTSGETKWLCGFTPCSVCYCCYWNQLEAAAQPAAPPFGKQPVWTVQIWGMGQRGDHNLSTNGLFCICNLFRLCCTFFFFLDNAISLKIYLISMIFGGDMSPMSPIGSLRMSKIFGSWNP